MRLPSSGEAFDRELRRLEAEWSALPRHEQLVVLGEVADLAGSMPALRLLVGIRTSAAIMLAVSRFLNAESRGPG